MVVHRCAGWMVLLLATVLLVACSEPEETDPPAAAAEDEERTITLILRHASGQTRSRTVSEEELLADPMLPERFLAEGNGDGRFTGTLEMHFPAAQGRALRLGTGYRDGVDVGPVTVHLDDVLLREYVTDGTDSVERLWWGPQRPRSVAELSGEQLHGDWQAYYVNGQAGFRVRWREGVPHGPATGWAPDGEEVFSGQYADGEPVEGVLPESLDAYTNRVLLSPRWFEEDASLPPLTLVDVASGEQEQVSIPLGSAERDAWEALRNQLGFDAEALDRSMPGSITDSTR